MVQTLKVEVTSMRKKSTMATVVREYIRISGRELVYEFVSGKETYRMLGVEETSLTATRTWGNTLGVGEMSTMATMKTHSNEAYMDRVGKNKTYLGRVGKSVLWKETVKTLGVEVTLRIATETWRGDLGVGEISPMAT